MMIQYKEIEQVSNTWESSGDHYRIGNKSVYWEMLPEIISYQQEMITGNRNLSYKEYILNRLKESGKRNLKGLSIGCGEGSSPESYFCESGIFESFDIFDISRGLIDKQAKLAKEKSLDMLNYKVVDLNEVKLKKNTYDLVWAVGTIHHIANLESLFKNINTSLKKDGLFVCREYVGPNYLQLTNEQLDIVNSLLKVVPEKYLKFPDNSIKVKESGPDKEELGEIDPSESVRSNDIVRIMKKELNIIQFSETGGTILHPFLNQIAFNFEKGRGLDYLKVLIELEKLLIKDRQLPSDYIFAIGTKR